jgi:hypothetical protein
VSPAAQLPGLLLPSPPKATHAVCAAQKSYWFLCNAQYMAVFVCVCNPYLVDEGVIDPEDRDLFWSAETRDLGRHVRRTWRDRDTS